PHRVRHRRRGDLVGAGDLARDAPARRDRPDLDAELRSPHAIDVVERADLRAHLVGHGVVERQDHQRLAARVKTPYLHRRDVHVVLAEQRADAADEARLVLVFRKEQVTLDRNVDPKAVNEHDPRLALHQRPADRGAADLHREQRPEACRFGLAVFADVEAASASDRERVHEVHALLAERLEQTLHHGRAQWLRVDLEQLTGVVELDAAGPLIEELRRERPEALSETYPRAAASLIGRWTWGVHRVARGFAVDDVEHLTDDIHGDVHLRLARRARDVRRKDSARRV